MERFSTEYSSPDEWVEEVGEIPVEEMIKYKEEILEELRDLELEKFLLWSWVVQINKHIKQIKDGNN